MLKLRDLLQTKDNWTKHHLALNDKGKDVPAYSKNACKWCLDGALIKVYPPGVRDAERIEVKAKLLVACNNVAATLGIPTLEYVYLFNDHAMVTFDHVCQAIDLAGA